MTKKTLLLAAILSLAVGGTGAAEALPPPGGAAPGQPAAADNQVAPLDNQATPLDNQAAGRSPSGRTSRTEPGKKPVYISMDFTDVDLPVLIKFMSEQTRKNVIFDERVQGKVTVISPRKITIDEAYEVFLSVLQVKGFTIIEQGNTVKVVPLREARQESLPTMKEVAPPATAEFITRLIPLQYVDAAEIVPLLTPLVSKDGLVSMFASSNTLVVIDSGANLDRILKIIAELDMPGTQMTVKVITLKYAVATELVKTLDALFKDAASGGVTAPAAQPLPPGAVEAPGTPARGGRPPRPGKGKGPTPKFLADARINTLIVLGTRELIADVEELVRKLDVPAPEISGKINVYYLENADAEELAKVLASFSEKRPGAPAQPGQPERPRPVPAAQPAQPGQPAAAAELEGGVKITADKATNSLIIIASANDYQTLIDVIRKLDIRRRQVYVEALIMEINLDKSRDLGVEFRGAIQTGGNNGAILTGTNFGFTGNVNDLLTALAAGNPLLFAGSGLVAGGIGGNVTLPDGTQIPAITAVLRAAQGRTNVNVLSSPHLLTTDNKEAEIIVGQNIPIITSQARDTTTTNLSNVINTIERKDVGVTLKLTPHIHESEFMTLDIFQESSAVLPQAASLTAQVGPTTTKRSAKTSVLVKNGETVVLGGMMQDTISTTESKVPLLGDIPLLGWLFKFNSVSRAKTNLLIFLTPHIIKNPADMQRITGDQKEKMDRFVDQNKGEVERIIPDKEAPPPAAPAAPAPPAQGGAK